MLATLSLLALAGSVTANAPDPLKSDVWGSDYTGTYRYTSAFDDHGWMKPAVNSANAAIGHATRLMEDGHIADLRNPDFHVTTSASANGTVDLKDSPNVSCNGIYSWVACADAYSDETFRLWFSTYWCWRDNDSANKTCHGNDPASWRTFDMQTVALNEMGHVNRLSHHIPTTSHDVQGSATYDDAVVQAISDPYSHIFGVRHSLAWADRDALMNPYGWRDDYGCAPPPCSFGPAP